MTTLGMLRPCRVGDAMSGFGLTGLGAGMHGCEQELQNSSFTAVRSPREGAFLLRVVTPNMGGEAVRGNAQGLDCERVLNLPAHQLFRKLRGRSIHRCKTMTRRSSVAGSRLSASYPVRHSGYDHSFLDSGGSENTGLALVAEAERRDAEAVLRSMVALEDSPMFQAALREAMGVQRGSESDPEDADFTTRLLCARLFLAGMAVCKLRGRR